jgi:hypothetical protein
MEGTGRSWRSWRFMALILLILAPLFCLFLLYGKPIPQDPAYHLFADARTCLGVRNFGNVVSNILFLLAGAVGTLWCFRNRDATARRSWMVFFIGVALVFFGSGYYHETPNNDTLIWDRLPMTVAFMGLFAALLSEHLGEKLESALLVPAVLVGIASVFWWQYSDDLRVYIWVQLTPLLVIPYVIAAFPGRHTHRHYLMYGVAFYALAKIAELYDYEVYALTGAMISGHSLKHLLAAIAPYFVYLMLRQRSEIRTAP